MSAAVALSDPDRAILRRRVAPLVDAALVAEHRERPFGPHSEALREVLQFVRRNPDPALPRYLVLDLGGAFAVAARPAERGAELVPLDDVRHPTRGDAEHDVFARRLRDLGIAP